MPSHIPDNAKSDVPAKLAFIDYLREKRGFDSAEITRSPADVTAVKDGQKFYFEIKYTGKTTAYFGAATLTEWEAALSNESQYRFVIARKDGPSWLFDEYEPKDFMQYSYIPPFKVFFNIPLSSREKRNSTHSTKKVVMTSDRMKLMLDLYKKMKST